MKRIKRTLSAILLAITLFIFAYKPSDHEYLSESPTERYYEIVPYNNGFDAIYTQVIDKQRQQAEDERKAKRQQALEEAHRLYDAKVAEEARRKAEAERQRIEAKRLVEAKRLGAQKQISHSNDANLTQLTMLATYYGPDCDGCSGITATGIDVTRTIYANGLRVIAVDPRVISLGSIVRVEYADGTTFKAIAGDVGSAIKNNRIDILVASENEAYRLGKQTVTVTILKNGKER
ncbi:3D domain-containing protein [Lysinibacillus sp. TE18511]